MLKEIKPIPAKPDQRTIDMLEELLEKAKTGELVSLIFVDKYLGDKVGHGWSGQPDHTMLGKLDEVKFCFFSQMYFPIEEG